MQTSIKQPDYMRAASRTKNHNIRVSNLISRGPTNSFYRVPNLTPKMTPKPPQNGTTKNGGVLPILLIAGVWLSFCGFVVLPQKKTVKPPKRPQQFFCGLRGSGDPFWGIFVVQLWSREGSFSINYQLNKAKQDNSVIRLTLIERHGYNYGELS